MKIILSTCALVLYFGTATAQYGIGTNATDPSALFELKSDSRGLLPPRMTEAQRLAIGTSSTPPTSPAIGLVVYQIDGTPGLYCYSGTAWTNIGNGTNSSDADNDGIADQFDTCPNTLTGVPVNSCGCPMDTDGDGVPDDRDDQLITPTACQPVNADGVGICPTSQPTGRPAAI